MRGNLAPPTGKAGRSPRRFPPEPFRRVLVVEDDHDIRRLNTEVLIHQGYRVDTAGNGAAAWAALQQNNYDLLVTDNEMPEVTGVELLQRLRAGRMDLPVIMATGRLPVTESARHLWLQPVTTLLKPYTMQEFLKAVTTVLRMTGSVRDLVTPAAGPSRLSLMMAINSSRNLIAPAGLPLHSPTMGGRGFQQKKTSSVPRSPAVRPSVSALLGAIDKA